VSGGIAAWCRLARRRSVVLRATRVAVVVGLVLILINQGDVLLAGELSPLTWLKLMLTPLVPYLVSTASSVAALRELGVGGE
jgi:hypothetical protein